MTVNHLSFSIERSYPHPPERVFAAWAEPGAKARWFRSPNPEWHSVVHEFAFVVGGRERVHTSPRAGGRVHAFDARYFDIVPNERIVYAYDMHVDARKISVSLTTVTFATVTFATEGAATAGTLMTFTEQAVLLDGYDDEGGGGRERGSVLLLAQLGESLG